MSVTFSRRHCSLANIYNKKSFKLLVLRMKKHYTFSVFSGPSNLFSFCNRTKGYLKQQFAVFQHICHYSALHGEQGVIRDLCLGVTTPPTQSILAAFQAVWKLALRLKELFPATIQSNNKKKGIFLYSLERTGTLLIIDRLFTASAQ